MKGGRISSQALRPKMINYMGVQTEQITSVLTGGVITPLGVNGILATKLQVCLV